MILLELLLALDSPDLIVDHGSRNEQKSAQDDVVWSTASLHSSDRWSIFGASEHLHHKGCHNEYEGLEVELPLTKVGLLPLFKTLQCYKLFAAHSIKVLYIFLTCFLGRVSSEAAVDLSIRLCDL